MMTFDELKTQTDLLNSIDWSMTPEKAVDMYLEWGAGWTRGNDFVRSANDESIYFVIYDWEKPSQVTLVRRNSQEVQELAKVQVPEEMTQEAFAEFGKRPGVGVYALTLRLKRWLAEQLGAPIPTE